MRKLAGGLVALLIVTAAPAVALQKPSPPSQASVGRGAPTPRAVAPSAASPGFAKSHPRRIAAKRSTQKKPAATRAKSTQANKDDTAKRETAPLTKAIVVSRRPVLQFRAGPAIFFAGWPFMRPGSPGAFGAGPSKDPDGGFVGWFGPVFWPYAYDDLFAYAFWPLDSFGHGESFWAFAYDDLFEGIFRANAAPETVREEIVAAAEGSDDAELSRTLGFEEQSSEFALICSERSAGLNRWPILRIAQSVGLTREQRTMLKDLQAAAAQAARLLKSGCPAEAPKTPLERIDAMQVRVEAMLRAIDLVRPALEKFYEPLSEAQKTPFRASPTPGSAGGEAVGPTSAEKQLAPQICSDRRFSARTIDRLETVVRPTDAQRTAFVELKVAAAKAARILRDACPADTPGNPPERLAAMQQRLGAMLDAATLLRPALEGFYDSLSDAQKARFDALGKQALRVGG